MAPPRGSRRAAAEKGTESLRSMRQSTIQFNPNGTLQAGHSPKSFKVSELIDDW